MKKQKRNNKLIATLTLLFVLGFVGGFTIAAKADEIIQYWKGETKIQTSMVNLDEFYKVSNILEELRNSNSEYEKDIEYLDGYNNQLIDTIKEYEKLVTDRDSTIAELHEDIKERDNVILVQIGYIDDLEAQLEQAYKDVTMVDNKIARVLEDVFNEIEE